MVASAIALDTSACWFTPPARGSRLSKSTQDPFKPMAGDSGDSNPDEPLTWAFARLP
jgi:hypothetical protein